MASGKKKQLVAKCVDFLFDVVRGYFACHVVRKQLRAAYAKQFDLLFVGGHPLHECFSFNRKVYMFVVSPFDESHAVAELYVEPCPYTPSVNEI